MNLRRPARRAKSRGLKHPRRREERNRQVGRLVLKNTAASDSDQNCEGLAKPMNAAGEIRLRLRTQAGNTAKATAEFEGSRNQAQCHGGIVRVNGKLGPHSAAHMRCREQKPQERMPRDPARANAPTRANAQWAANPWAGNFQPDRAEAKRHDTSIDAQTLGKRHIASESVNAAMNQAKPIRLSPGDATAS